MKKRFFRRTSLLLGCGLIFQLLSCVPEFKPSKIPELKLLLFPNGINSTSGTGTTETTCSWDSGVWDTFTWSN